MKINLKQLNEAYVKSHFKSKCKDLVNQDIFTYFGFNEFMISNGRKIRKHFEKNKLKVNIRELSKDDPNYQYVIIDIWWIERESINEFLVYQRLLPIGTAYTSRLDNIKEEEISYMNPAQILQLCRRVGIKENYIEDLFTGLINFRNVFETLDLIVKES